MKKNTKAQIILRSILAIALCIVIVFEVSVISKADTMLRITSTNTKNWTLMRSSKKTEYNLFRTKKTVTTTKKYKGNIYNTATYAVTGNHYHKKGCKDLTSLTSITETYTFVTSDSAAIIGFGAEMGYSYSMTSGKTVNSALQKNKATGYYYYGVRAKYVDLKVETKKDVYKKKKGKYVYTSTSNVTVKGTQLYTPNCQSALYYAWYKVK